MGLCTWGLTYGGLIYGGLIYGGLIYGGGVIHGRHFRFVITVFIVHLYKHENKQKLVCSDKQKTKHYYRYYMVYLNTLGLTFGEAYNRGGAYIWNGSNLMGL